MSIEESTRKVEIFKVAYERCAYKKVDDAEKEGIAGLNQGDGSEDTGICPLGRVWVGDIESCDGGGDDASVGRGEEPLDCCLVLWVIEGDAGHRLVDSLVP